MNSAIAVIECFMVAITSLAKHRRSTSDLGVRSCVSISISLLLSLVACRDPQPSAVDAQAEKPATGGPAPGGLSPDGRAPGTWDVVLVRRDDVLNMRAAADPAATIADTLPFDARKLRGTGESAMVGSARWLQLRTDRATGWANAAFLTESVEAAAFAADPRPKQRLEELARIIAARGDLRSVVSPRGLWVHHYGSVAHYKSDELATLAASAKKEKWNGPACGEACIEGTFADLIGRPLAAVLAKSDRRTATDERLKGGNASADPPAELTNFHFLSVMDPGTDAADHLDWRSFAIYFDHVEHDPRIVAIVPDAWSP